MLICTPFYTTKKSRKLQKYVEWDTPLFVVLFVDNSGAEIKYFTLENERDCKYKHLRTDDKTKIIGINKNIM